MSLTRERPAAHSSRTNSGYTVGLTLRNSLFAGSEHAIETWANASTLITACRLNRVDPEAWITHALIEIRDGCTDVQLLLPWHPPARRPRTAMPRHLRSPRQPPGDGRRAGVTPRQSQTSNRTESSARERRRIPSEIGGQQELPSSGH